MIFRLTGVVGAGTMGHGLALTFAKGGYQVILTDISEAALDTAKKKVEKSLSMFIGEGLVQEKERENILGRISYTTELSQLKDCDYIVECIVEKIEPKQQLFKTLDEICIPETILASNTSSLKLTDITRDVTKHRDKVILTHFFNPAQIVPLVELLRIDDTSDETYNKTKAFHEKCGKVTIEVKKEVPGLIANRIQAAMAREVFSLYEQGVASAEDIDKAVIAGPGFRLSISGLLEIADLGGIDIWYAVMKYLYQFIESGTEVNKVLAEMVKENKLGAKTGQGFYKYSGQSLDSYIYQRDLKLLKQLVYLENLNKTIDCGRR